MKVVLITGCSTGIGHATALHLARQGYHVFASMHTPATGSALLIQAARDEGLHLDVIQLDVNDTLSAEQAIKTVLEKTGRLNVLVNNAGIGGGSVLEETPENKLRAIFETNFFGAMRMMRLVLPTMREAGRGVIVNVSSIAGRVTLGGVVSSAYAGSKFALEAASETLAQEVYSFGIRVAIIEPGVVKTPIFKKGGNIPQPANSPYRDLKLRGERFFGSRLENPAPPQLVADVIHHAIETQEPKLRYLVGKDAEEIAVGRQKLTDETLIKSGRAMSLDAFAVFYKAHFGLEI